MSADGVLGSKKHRRAEGMVGFPLKEVQAWGSSLWLGETPDGRYVRINPRSGEWSWDKTPVDGRPALKYDAATGLWMMTLRAREIRS